MELKEILNFIKKHFPDKSIDISESLELLRDTIDEIINDVSCKTRQAYNERNFNVIEGFIEFGKAADEYEKKIDEIINYTSIERTDITEECDNNVDNNKFIADIKTEHTLHENFTHIRPYGFKFYKDKMIETKTWQAMLLKTCELLLKNDEKKFLEFQNNVNMNGKKNKYFSVDSKELRKPEIIDGKIYVETNMSGNAIRNLIVKMLMEYNVKINEFKVYFRADYSADNEGNSKNNNVNDI